ncbi:MAG: alpha-mannosidase [Herbinix sp.]|nr:alpha-mannosidase [Herbinix sp.]
MSKKIVHIISHSHWDREWYLPFEKHRLKLVELIDNCFELFENSDGFQSFHLDGQTIVLDDYLEIKPENREKLKKYVKEGKFLVGPWYILQDEFLTSSESNVRNLIVGMEEAKEFGEVCKVGYFPDAFGNAGQMPQVLKQAGMEAVVFGRGVRPVGLNNTLGETGEYESFYSEMIWNSPDGSGLLGILFANWYNNGAEIPVEEEVAKKYWDKRIKDVLQYASTDHLLLMNGCDHQPVQKNIAEAIEVANRLYPEIEFRHSNFNEYIQCVKDSKKDKLSEVTGELTSQATDGWGTLVNTTSARVYLKQLNRENEVALENLAEPLATFAAESGSVYPHETLTYAWKKLMQNHPHDSICGCSVDEVHREMETRYQKSLQVSEELIKDSMNQIGSRIDTSDLNEKEAFPFVVYNTSGWERTGVIKASVDIQRIYRHDLTDSYRIMKELPIMPLVLTDTLGKQIPCKITDAGVRFGYDLPDDKFRQPYMARTVEVSFEAEAVPALGYKVYSLQVVDNAEVKKETLVIEDGMENAYLKVTFNANGTINLLDKVSGKKYDQMCYYENTGDIGNEYIYVQPQGDKAIYSTSYSSNLTLVEDESYRTTYQITQTIEVPESADDTLLEEQRCMMDLRKRKAKRSSRLVPLTITTYVSLEKDGRGVKVRTEFDNKMKDHRLRVILPTGLDTKEHFADSVFEIVTRPNQHSKEWTNPSGCEHQQSFVGIQDENAGIVAANFGLYEYEILTEKQNALAITLLRAVGELGDWGVFPTPEAQVLKHCAVDFEIIPYSVQDETFDPIAKAYQFQMPLKANQIAVQEGTLPLEKTYLSWKGQGIYLTGFKNKHKSNHRIARFINGSGKEGSLTITKTQDMKAVYRSNVIEERFYDLIADDNGLITIPVKPYEIITIGIE